MNKKTQLATFFFIGFSIFSFGQIKEEKLILDKKREPEVKKIEKKKTAAQIVKNYPPQSKKAEDSLNLKYEIKDIPAVSDFHTSTLAGTDISPKITDDFQENYIKIGAGNYGKILADAFVSKAFTDKIDAGADFHYNSTSGLKNEYSWKSDQQNLSAALFLNGYQEKGKYNVTLGYDTNAYNYYGIYALKPSVDTDLKQQVNVFGAKGFYEFQNIPVLDRISVKTSFLNDHFGSTENSIDAQALLKKNFEINKLNNLNLGFSGNLEFQTIGAKFGILDKKENNNSILRFDPKIKLQIGKDFIAVGVNMNYVNESYKALAQENSSKNNFRVSPSIDAQYTLRPEFILYGALDGGAELNSYAELLNRNPYLISNQYLRPTYTKIKATIGAKGDILPNLKYDVNASYANLENIAMFRADSSYFGQNNDGYNWLNAFSTAYINGKKTEIKGNLVYFPIENLDIDAMLSYTSYDLDDGTKMLYTPALKSLISAHYTALKNKLRLGFTGIFSSSSTGNTFVYDETGVPQLTENQTAIGGYADLNLSAEYKIHKNFSIFALGNNLLNTKYQNYYSYKNLGAQFLGGIKFSF